MKSHSHVNLEDNYTMDGPMVQGKCQTWGNKPQVFCNSWYYKRYYLSIYLLSINLNDGQLSSDATEVRFIFIMLIMLQVLFNYLPRVSSRVVLQGLNTLNCSLENYNVSILVMNKTASTSSNWRSEYLKIFPSKLNSRCFDLTDA